MNFDRLAPHYDWMEALCGGGLLQRARTVWLDELRGCEKILSVGEGHGRFAEACAQRFPNAKLTCVEASASMLARAQARTRDLPGAINWQHADWLTWTPTEKSDAIVTCFFLDCFTPTTLATVVAKLADCSTDRTRWLVVDFAIPPRGPARWRARGVHALMYFFFRRVADLSARQLTPPDDLLRAHGFTLSDRREFNFGLLRADLWRRGNTSFKPRHTVTEKTSTLVALG